MQPQYPQQPQYPVQPPTPKKSFFQRPLAWILITVIVLGCGMCGLIARGINATTTSANGNGNAASTSSTPKVNAQWTTVQTFSGSGAKKTATFTIGNTWRINWTCTPSSFMGDSYNLMVGVDASDGTPIDLVAINTICKAGNTSDTTNEHQGGNVYLDVNSEGDWTLTVQELK